MKRGKTNELHGALMWKLLERFGVQGVQFVLQIILARMLSPDHYGTLSIMLIFVNLASVFIQAGFNTSLIQNKDVAEEDYSSVFWITLLVSVFLYGVIFLAAPVISDFYNMPDIVVPMRVLALMLLPGALNSIQLAKVSREMDFRKVFYSSVAGIILSGILGVVIAWQGGGVWALVFYNLGNVSTACLVMHFTAKWKIRPVCNLRKVKILFSFGWKLLVSGLLDTLYQDLRSLVIGKKYDSDTLGYYNRGKQFPQFFITAVSSTVQSVMLPTMSAMQNDQAAVKQLTRNSIMISSYILFPLMAGLAGVATPLTSLLLTDKWLPCVPYMQIYCFSLAFNPIHVCNLQAINAIGRSDIFLKLEIIKKVIGFGSLVIAVAFFNSPIAIAMTGVFTTFTSCFINAYPNKKLIGYSYAEQVKDIIPSFLLAVVMCGCVMAVETLGLGSMATLGTQVVLGVIVYVSASALLRLWPFRFLLGLLTHKEICGD